MSLKPALVAVALAGLAAGCGGGTTAPQPAAPAPPATSAAPGSALSAPRVFAHLDLANKQQPENIALLPDGSAAVTFALSRQIAQIGQDGSVRVLATLPAPAAGAKPPVLGTPFLGGIVRADDGTLYFNYATGSADLTGVWKLSPGGTPQRLAALPANGLPNGLAREPASGTLYVADSVLGTIWRVPAAGGTATAWAKSTALAPTGGYLGANGIKVNRGAVWATNSDQGTVLRIPLAAGGAAGPISTVATGMPIIDDFAFTGQGNTLIAALDRTNEVALVHDDGTHAIVLTGKDGLQSPTSIAVRGSDVFVASAAYNTNTDPNLLRATLSR
jgi:sugar lactone lactonase YvrE